MLANAKYLSQKINVIKYENDYVFRFIFLSILGLNGNSLFFRSRALTKGHSTSEKLSVCQIHELQY